MAHALISVVIINSGSMLTRVLQALSKQTLKNFEAIAIDNCSSDNSWRTASAYAIHFPRQLIRLDRNIGFAADNNSAIEQHAHNGWIFLLNPNAVPEAECLQNIEQNIKQYPDVDCFACTLIDANNPTRLDGIGDDYHIITWIFIKNMPAPLIFFLLSLHLLMIIDIGLTFAATRHLKVYLKAKYEALKNITSLLPQSKAIKNSCTCTSLSLLIMMRWLPRNFSSN